jgi:hypothetical protein
LERQPIQSIHPFGRGSSYLPHSASRETAIVA